MKFIVLGSGTSVPHAERASAAFWLETEGGSLLLDCSADAPHRMAQESLDWLNLDAIWISHLHLDHCGGLAPFLFGIKWASGIERRTKPLRIFGCEGINVLLKAIDESNNYQLLEQPFPVEIHEISAAETFQSIAILEGIDTKTVSTPHRPESLAIRLKDFYGKTLVYTSDTGYSEALAEFSREADLLVMECSFYRNKPTAKHLELSDAMRMVKIAKPRKLLLTHLYPAWDDIDLASEAKKLWPGETIAAYDGLRLEV